MVSTTLRVVGSVAAMAAGMGLAAACSSSDDASTPACEYVGTYSLAVDDPSAGCQFDPDAGPPPSSSGGTTVTISGPIDGNAYAVQLQGLQGGCRGEVVAGCKLQTQCSITLIDALDPNNNVGTYQFSWTFTHAGFTGLETLSLPPGKGLSKGCDVSVNGTATRR